MGRKQIEQFNEKCEWLRKGVLYHRGKHDSFVKENTIEAIKGAIDDNLSIEIDVRLTKDKKVVVSHDDSLKRVFGVDKKISDCNYEEIKEITNNGVPLFEDVLLFVNDKIGIMVEIKSNKIGELEDRVYDLLKDYKGRYVIVCFNPFTLGYFKKKDPSIIRGQLSYNYENSKFNFIFKFMLRKMWFNFISKPHFISYGINRYDKKVLAKYRKKGYFIIGWTYTSEKDKEDLSKVYDNMIVENLSIKEF